MPVSPSAVRTAALNASATSGSDVISGTSGADAFFFNNSVATGKDTISSFGSNDTLVFTSQLYDSNNDGIIKFNATKGLSIYYDGQSLNSQIVTTGNDAVKLGGVDPSKGVRFLGAKDGLFYYAAAATRPAGVIEGAVGNDTFNAAGSNFKYFYDTALGLNLGNDVIRNASLGDQIITTSKVWDSNNDGIVRISTSVLRLPGATGGTATDPTVQPGGTITFDSNVTSLKLTSVASVNGVSYFTYTVQGLPPLES